jgi:hypothetical protein
MKISLAEKNHKKNEKKFVVKNKNIVTLHRFFEERKKTKLMKNKIEKNCNFFSIFERMVRFLI